MRGSWTTWPLPSMWSGPTGCGRSSNGSGKRSCGETSCDLRRRRSPISNECTGMPMWNSCNISARGPWTPRPRCTPRRSRSPRLPWAPSSMPPAPPWATGALVRPPGHHAGPDYGGGFCYLNNVAVAAAEQAAAGRKVAILDYDAHHGNGTRDIFADSSSVLYVSTHQFGIYPGTGPAEDVGTGEGRGFTVNIPFTAGCGDASYRAAADSIIEPILTAVRPDVILVSLGIDAHYRDPLTSLTLSSPAYVDLMSRSAASP